MKLEKNRIHLLIMLFAVSSLLVHVPSDAYAAVDTWTDATTTDVWVQGTDRSGNFFKVSLPLTLKVAGNEPLFFESKVDQKVLGFYDESILNDVVSDWTGTQQDVSELAKILGIVDEQLPPWVTNLAVWVSEDRISMGDMIVSIEYLINN